MIGCSETLVLNPGQDWLDRTAPRDDGGVVDMTGWTAEIRDLDGVLTASGAVTASIVSGEVQVSITWQAGWPLVGGKLGSFRLALLQGGTEMASYPREVWVSNLETEWHVARGADQTPQFIWDDDRMGADLTGDTIEVINASATLGPLLSAGILNAATRRVWFHLEGDPATPTGDLGTFQLQRSTGGTHRRTTNLIRVICE